MSAKKLCGWIFHVVGHHFKVEKTLEACQGSQELPVKQGAGFQSGQSVPIWNKSQIKQQNGILVQDRPFPAVPAKDVREARVELDLVLVQVLIQLLCPKNLRLVTIYLY